MNIFIYSGSNNEKSFSNNFMEEIANSFSKTEDEVIFRTPLSIFIEKNTSESCFNKEDILKKEILNSDVIIFCSPVYLHNVSGEVKFFLDSLAEWSHTMALCGKLGIVLSVSSSSGNEYVNNYLIKILQYMGVNIIGNFEINRSEINDNLENSKKEILTKIKTILNSAFKYGVDVAEEHEKIFKSYQNMYNNGDYFSNSELAILEKLQFSKRKNFQELFDINFKGGTTI